MHLSPTPLLYDSYHQTQRKTSSENILHKCLITLLVDTVFASFKERAFCPTFAFVNQSRSGCTTNHLLVVRVICSTTPPNEHEFFPHCDNSSAKTLKCKISHRNFPMWTKSTQSHKHSTEPAISAAEPVSPSPLVHKSRTHWCAGF